MSDNPGSSNAPKRQRKDELMYCNVPRRWADAFQRGVDDGQQDIEECPFMSAKYIHFWEEGHMVGRTFSHVIVRRY